MHGVLPPIELFVGVAVLDANLSPDCAAPSTMETHSYNSYYVSLVILPSSFLPSLCGPSLNHVPARLFFGSSSG